MKLFLNIKKRPEKDQFAPGTILVNPVTIIPRDGKGVETEIHLDRHASLSLEISAQIKVRSMLI